MAATLGELAKLTGSELDGDANYSITHSADAASAVSDSLIYFNSIRDVENVNAGAAILSRSARSKFSGNKLLHDNPRAAFALATTALHSYKSVFTGVHASVCVADDVQIGDDVSVGANSVVQKGAVIGSGSSIGAGCFIGENVSIGADTRIDHNVVVYGGVNIGAACELMSGVVVGADGFGFEWSEGKWLKIPQLGSVVIGDNVSIGANTTVDCGTIHNTIIEAGVVIDNQVQIGHNVMIGEHTVICGCTAIAGSSVIGKRCCLGGRVSIVNHIKICDDVHVQATSVVTRSLLKPGVYSSTLTAQPVSIWKKTLARLRQLDALTQRLKSLEKNN